MNIKFLYLYRDGGNYKNFNEVVFTNKMSRDIDEVREIIVSKLIDGTWLYANRWDLPDLHFSDYKYDPTIDVDWHEFEEIQITKELPTCDKDIEDLIKLLKHL